MTDYDSKPEFGEQMTGEHTQRDIWWEQVIEHAKSADGDFVELLNLPVSASTIATYRHEPNKAPAVFLDPMFEIRRYDRRWWVRYLPDKD